MSKSLTTPIIIILAAGAVAAMAVFSGGGKRVVSEVELAKAELRQADLEITGMFCIGCSGSVEGAVSQMPGVVSVTADSKTDSGVVIYDSSVISVDAVLESPIFKTYPASLASDKEYNGPAVGKSPEENLPEGLKAKLAEVSIVMQRKRDSGEDIKIYEDAYLQLNLALEEKRYSNATLILDSLLQLGEQ